MGNESPVPADPDVRLAVRIGGARPVTLVYRACLTAALTFAQDNALHRYVDAVAVSPIGLGKYPRLPNERLYV
ncbi:hypothetical protein SAMN05421776_11783 [Nocardia farcinica]|uniref:Uncharacterized protein n=1 Tax=Nocardia farcinica TaxID=37329 RepID=A0A0H5NWL1_NOCFR|nr:hypothetical protein CJ469_05691 [Nocardia farcinica]PFX06123.1 hypothetical protein CJ468_04989 [Nocardia farcinica]CRY79867.1 Uncharacterised protein [Nocardia farcinica]SIT33694.1 hypothetical protein SAMN05421776_11783 [Nocardia farcinica]